MPGYPISAGRRLLSGSVLRLCNLVVAAISSFFLMPFIVHHLGDRIYGFWTLATAFIGYYGLLDFGLSTAVSQYMSIAIGKKDKNECRTVFNTALRIQSLIGCLALVVTALIIVATPWFTKTRADAVLFREVIALLGIAVAATFPARAYSGLLDAELRFDIQSMLSILFVIVRTGLTILAVLRGHGLLSLAWIQLGATLLGIVFQIYFAKRQVDWAEIHGGSLDPKMAKAFFSYSIFIFLAAIADILRFQVDALVIASLIGLAAVTHYRVATVLARYFTDIVVCITGMIQPLLSRLHGAKDRLGLEKVFFFATKVSLSSSLFIAAGLIAWGKPFIVRWMGVRYEDAYWPLVALTISVLLDVGQNPSVSLLYATFKHRFYTYMNCSEGLINLALSIALARPLGIIGVALGTLLAAFLIRIVVQPYLVCRVSGLPFRHYLTSCANTVLRSIGILGIGLALVLWGLQPNYLLLSSSALAATIIYAIGSWRLIFDSSEREQLLAIAIRKQSVHAELV
jgi:O-antigen/teichoic acid export membrane protein